MKRNKRLLLIAIPLVIFLSCMVLYEYVFQEAWAQIAEIRHEQDAKLVTLKKYITLIAEKPELEKKLAALNEQAKTEDAKLVTGDPVSLASANFQGLVKGVVAGRGGSVSSERIVKAEPLSKPQTAVSGTPPQTHVNQQVKAPNDKKNAKAAEVPSSLQVIGVSIDATVPDTAALTDMLYSLETRTPYVVLKDLDIRIRNFKEPLDLMVKIDASALYEGK